MTDIVPDPSTDLPDPSPDLPQYPTPRDVHNPYAPPPELLALHESRCPVTKAVTWDGTTPWLVTGHAAQRELLTDARLSANIGTPGYPHTTQAMKDHAAHFEISINSADGAEHTRFRRSLTNSFTRSRMARLRPEIQRITDDLIDRMLAGPKPADLHQNLSLPLPSLMICALLGVPYEDHEFFQEHAAVTTARFATQEQQVSTMMILREYIGGLIEAKKTDQNEDVLSDLAEKVESGNLTMSEARALGHILLVAGHDTSANMVTLGTALLLQHPDQLELLRRNGDDEKFVAGAVEELLRYLSIPHLLARRVAVEDIEIEGQTIRAGDGVITALPAANWDPEVFPDPGTLDLARPASQHLAFGWGPHQCVGQQLARIELQVVFSTLFRRLPDLAMVSDPQELRFKEDSQAYGIHELLITW